MNNQMKVIPIYLPQFHQIPENDEWWGKGFTEWVNIKAAKPLFPGHNQPRVPLDENYYDLSQLETLKWQCKIAKEYGIYGFAMYHYWFNGHLLLEKPMEMLLAHPEIDTRYMISWANHDWTDAWKAAQGKTRTLIFNDFDNEEDWVNHFYYFLPFFKDERYIKEDGMPLLIIYVPQFIGKLNKMLDLWTEMAKANGIPGIKYIYQAAAASIDKTWDRSRFTYGIQTNPQYAQYASASAFSRFKTAIFTKYGRKIRNLLGIKGSLLPAESNLIIRDYDEDWEKVLRLKPDMEGSIPGAMTDWDNTPRMGTRGWCYRNASPDKFRKYFKMLLKKARTEYRTDKVFVFAWNEWAEGGHLEPDMKNGYGYLEAIKACLDEEALQTIDNI